MDAFVEALSIPAEEFVAEDYLAGEGDFVSYNDHIQQMERALEVFELEGPGDISIYQIADKFDMVVSVDESGDFELFEAIQVPRLARIANQHGVYQIGNTVRQYKGSKSYTAAFENVKDFTDLSTALNVEISTSGSATVSHFMWESLEKSPSDCTNT